VVGGADVSGTRLTRQRPTPNAQRRNPQRATRNAQHATRNAQRPTEQWSGDVVAQPGQAAEGGGEVGLKARLVLGVLFDELAKLGIL
jgi:hypothetical protein